METMWVIFKAFSNQFGARRLPAVLDTNFFLLFSSQEALKAEEGGRGWMALRGLHHHRTISLIYDW